MGETPEILEGMRVRLKAERAEGYLQPYRKFAQEGREGTVTNVLVIHIRVEFATKRKGAKAIVDFVQPSRFWRDYEVVA